MNDYAKGALAIWPMMLLIIMAFLLAVVRETCAWIGKGADRVGTWLVSLGDQISDWAA